MKHGGLVLIFLLATVAATPVGAYPWDQDMVDQPSEKAQESIAPPGPGSVPINGGETLPIPMNDEEAADMKDAAASLENPVPANQESI